MRLTAYITSAMLIILVILFGCGENHDSSTGPGSSNEPGEPGSITFTILHEDGTPIEGVDAWVSGTSIVAITANPDTNGVAVIDSLMPGSYTLRFSRNSSYYLSYAYDVDLASGEQYTHTTIIPETVDYEMVVECQSPGQWGMTTTEMIPLSNTEITLEPGSYRSVTNAEGVATFTDIPIQEYTVTTTRNGISGLSSSTPAFRFSNGDLNTNILRVSNFNPEIVFQNFALERYYNIYGAPLILTVTTNDFYNGKLSDDQIEWKSDRDGLLGYGSTLRLNFLTPGTHTISVTGKNSVEFGSGTTKEITVYVFAHSDQSFFPLADGAYWRYGAEPSEITVEDWNGEEAIWSLSDWEIVSNEVNVFTGSITGTIETTERTDSFKYTVTDTYGFDGTAILKKKSVEQMTITDASSDDQDGVIITTTYDSPLMLLEDHFNPDASTDYSQLLVAEIKWTYTQNGRVVLNRTEHHFLDVTAETGIPKQIHTKSGSITAVPVTMSAGDDTRTTYYAPGIGIAGSESDLFGFPMRTELIETDIADIVSQQNAEKWSGTFGTSRARIPVSAEQDTPERLSEYCRIMRGLYPW